MSLNILGENLDICGCSPMTGWYRDGYCRTDLDDYGIHTVCAIVTKEFLEFSKETGNNLDMLKPGDHWCLCAGRWYDAYKNGVPCPINLSATNEETLAIIPKEILLAHGHK